MFLRRRQEDLHESVQSKNIPKRQRKDDPLLDLIPRLFDRMKRGVWFRVLPIDNTFNDVCLAMNQEWEDVLQLLIDHGF
jgi:hypothetical protein